MRLVGLLLAAFCLAACGADGPACPSPGFICALAGTGQRAFNGDGHLASETSFYLVSAVRLGPDGRPYIMDYNNQRIRVIQEDGRITTIAGSGIHAYATPGVPAIESPLENPIDMDFLPSGEMVFVSLHDPRVLHIDDQGILRVIAGLGTVGDRGDGGMAINATFTEVTGLAVAPDGSVYVADSGANRVRVIRPDGIIEAFAGTGEAGYSGDGGPALAAQLSYPSALAVGPDGSVYIAETKNHVVRRVLPDGTITTFAGTGSAGLSADGGPANAASLKQPEGLAVAADGTVYISEWLSHRIRRVDPAGTITTLAGTGEAGFAGDDGPADKAQLARPARLSLSGDMLYVADQANSCARVVYLESWLPSEPAP